MIPMPTRLPICRCWWTAITIFFYSVILHRWNGVIVTTNVVAESVFFQSTSVDEVVTLQPRPTAKIVGGIPVTTSDSALYASFAIPKFDTLFCGSMLIWEDVLLSAAHCEGGYNFTAQRVMIGGTTLNGTNAVETNIPVRKAIIHPDYKVASIDNQVENDIMLVFLQRTTNPIIPLAKFNTEPTLPPDNANATVIGHGIDNRTTNELTYQLNALNMTIVNFFTCDNAYDVLIEDLHLCATGTPTAIAPCEGDSGGPLLYYDSVKNETVIVGVVSFGVCVYRPNFPSTVFTRLSSYTNWILQTICTNSLRLPTNDMCRGIVPLTRIPQSPSSAPVVSPTIPSSPVVVSPTPTVETDNACSRNDNATTNTNACNYLFVFKERGSYVHRSIFGVCIQKCTILRNVYLRTGWDCGRC